MNLTASHLTSGGELEGGVQNGRFYKKEGGAKKLLAKEKEGLFQVRSPFLRGNSRGSHQL